MYEFYIKRLFDFIFSFIAILILLPLFIISAIIIFIGSKGPIFFIQERVGYKEKLFKVIKFRTMLHKKRDEAIQVNLDNSELIPFGDILRRFKLDELPQLINILIGDMSLVGPRPFIKEIYKDMPKWAKLRYQVKPGLTGYAQIKGGILLNWEEKWSFDISYYHKKSFFFDLLIIFKTFKLLIFGEKKSKI